MDSSTGFEFDYYGHATKRWCEYGEAATEEFVSKHPGQRPKLWWRYSAPESWDDGETQDEYLERLGLWLPGERERLERAPAM
jgi:hypothetical protein